MPIIQERDREELADCLYLFRRPRFKGKAWQGYGEDEIGEILELCFPGFQWKY